jgi:hypothetical protein
MAYYGNEVNDYNVEPIVDTFTDTNGVKTTWALSIPPTNVGNLFVNIDGVLQLSDGSAYSVSGTNIVFSEAPPTDSVVVVRVIAGGRDIGVVGNETINASKIDGNDITAINTKLNVYDKTETYSQAEVDNKVSTSQSSSAGAAVGLSIVFGS